MSCNASRSRSEPAPSGSSKTWREPTCIGCSRDSPMRNMESVGDIKAMSPSYPEYRPEYGPEYCLVTTAADAYRHDMDSALRQGLQADLRVALENRDGLRLSVLRTTLSALSNAEAVDPADHAPGVSEVPRRVLEDEEIRSVVERERDELRVTAYRMHRVGAHDRARELLGQAAVLDTHLGSAQ